MNPSDSPDLPLSEEERVMEVHDRYETAWLVGRAPPVEVFIADEGIGVAAEPLRRVLLERLIGLEVDYRRLLGESPMPLEFHDRFPGDPDAVLAAFADSTESFWRPDVIDPPDGESGPVPIGSTVPDPAPDRYQMIRLLGRGSFGKVWLMQDVELGRLVAMKALRSRRGTESNLIIEAQTLSSIVHPNVVQIYDIRKKAGECYIFLQYVEGGSLAESMNQRRGPLGWREAARYIADVGDGLAFIHKRGVGHFDIKPENILWEQAGDRALITDFGVAACTSEPVMRRVGTRPYMAPEAIDFQPEFASDVYSLTATLYHLVTGRVPFLSGSWNDLKREIYHGLPDPDPNWDEKLPKPLMQLIRTGLKYEPRERIKLADLVNGLREILDEFAPRIITENDFAPRVITGSMGFDHNGVPALLVRLVVAAARKSLQDEEIINRLGIDRDVFDQILKEWPVSLRRERLERLCKAADLLPRRSDTFDAFFFGRIPDLTGLASRLSMLTSSGHAGSKPLIDGLEAAIRGPAMGSQWRTIVGPRLAGIEDDRLHKQTLEQIYVIANLIWTPHENDQLIVFDFRTSLWQSIIGPSQSTLDDTKFTHVHYANIVIADLIAKHLADDPEQKPTVTLLEGGVGGANTTCEVLSRMDEAWRKRRGRLPFFLFKGYELHPGFAYYADAMMGGQALTVPETPAHIAANDSRVRTFSSLSNRLRPFEGRLFVEERNMFDGIRDLERQGYYGRFDVFLCSFAFHHVPNTRRLRQYLLHGSPDDPVGKREAFRHDLLNGLRQLRQQEEPGDTRTREGAVTLALTPRCLPDDDLDSFARDLQRGSDFKNGQIVPDWLACLEDRQRMILVAIRKLLRPGGLVAIADPDGFSDFNRRQLARNPEMGIAYFLTSGEMEKLLTDEGFVVVEGPLVLRERRGKFVRDRFEASSARRSSVRYDSDIIDDNRGYVIIARKKH